MFIDEKKEIQFYLKVALGKHYEGVVNAECIEDLYRAALNIAWKPAFSRISKNVADANDQVRAEAISELLGYFKEYTLKENSEAHADYLEENIENLKNAIKNVKEISGISFGHFQKLFNMAVKWCYCFDMHVENPNIPKTPINYDKADCPIDNKILVKLDAMIDEEQRAKILKKAERKNAKKLSQISWKKLNADTYKLLQAAISTNVGDQSNLSFDFENWSE